MGNWPTSCLLGAACLLAATNAGAEVEYDLGRCAERVRDHPHDDDSYRCYWAASRHGHRDGAVRALEALLAIDPDNPHILYYLAHIARDLGRSERAIGLYRKAAEGIAKADKPVREVWAWISLAYQPQIVDRMEEAEETLTEAMDAADRSGDPVLRARSRVFAAQLDIRQYDYGAALLLLQEAERIAPPEFPAELRANLLNAMRVVYQQTGRYYESLEVFRREMDLLQAIGNPRSEVRCRYTILITSHRIAEFERRIGLEDEIRDFEELLELAMAAGERWIEGCARLGLGHLLEGDEGIDQLGKARELFRETSQRRYERIATREIEEAIVASDPSRREEGMRWIEAALDEARATGHTTEVAVGHISRATLLARTAARDAWVGEFARALDAGG